MDRRGITRVLSAAAALSALGAITLGAQDTTRTGPRSTKTIPIRKEAAGELAKPIHDTVTVYRTDTLRLTTPPITVHDTVTVTVFPKPTPPNIPDGFYAGVAGGGSLPYGAAWIPNSAGWTMQGQLGWQGAKQLLGARIDALPFAKQAPATFVNDQGVLMTVDPPSADRQPVFVAIPLSADTSKPQETADRSKAH